MWLSSLFVAFSLLMVFSEAKLAPTVRLNNGYEIPLVGTGTYLSSNTDAYNSVKDAIDIGYRHIDTAYYYQNEVDVGNAIRDKIDEGVIKREDIFVVTKLWNTFHEREWTEKAFSKSFDNLNLGYIDLYLMHFPEAFKRVLKSPDLDPNDIDSYNLLPRNENGDIIHDDIDFVETWQAMEKLVESGRVRSIGISNFNAEQTERILANSRIAPVTNQVECHPRKNQLQLIKFSTERNITVTAHTPLGRPASPDDHNSPISNPKVVALAQKYKRSPAQIILRYTLQNGAIIIPKSTKKERLEENLNVFDFTLSDSDMQIIHTLNNS